MKAVPNYQEYTREDIEALAEWPCQDILGGRMPFADSDYCQHPQCHPRNSPEYEAQQQNQERGIAMEADKTITILTERYKELVADQNFLRALQGAGVDNWEGYDAAQEMMSND